MLIVGLMSGTSLDGIDACLVEIGGAGDRLRVRTRHFLTHPWPNDLRERLKAVIDRREAPLETLTRLDVELGEAFAEAARACCAAAGVPLEAVAAIGSHGQTLWHAPSGPHAGTWQAGNLAVIAERTGVTTLGQFRAADMAAGGQGAPLVPYVDHVLFGHLGRPIALQNIGGIGNVTYLPGTGELAGLTAFDTGPGNMVIDHLAALATGGALAYDQDGQLAARGRVEAAWLAELLEADAYLAAAPPKSTGREAYGAPRAEALWAEAQRRGLSIHDAIATATAWSAATIADQYRRFLPGMPSTIYVSGGGARNPVLMRELAARVAPTPVQPVSALGLDPDAKEALAFAVLAHQTLLGVSANAPAATGARGPRVLGSIAPGANFARLVVNAEPEAAPGALTERANPASEGLDTLSPLEAVTLMHQEDYAAVAAVGQAREAIARLVESAARSLGQGGRLFYLGAGTSGRLGVLDASECPPTFSVPPEWVQGLIAGGEAALTRAIEGAEDDREAGAQALSARHVGPRDLVVGLSANGNAPYVQGALDFARAAGASTALVTCNPLAPGAHVPDVAVVLPVGPEVLAGSSRLKAGTATKLVLNMTSTLAMVQLGKVHDNMMVDLRVSNRKLQGRAEGLVARLTGLPPEAARDLLASADQQVKTAVVMHHQAVDAERARALLAEAPRLRRWMGQNA